MHGYLIFDIEITDHDAWAEYQRVAGPVLAASGGKFMLSSDTIEPLEGGWCPASISVVQFPSPEAAREFYYSDAYQETIALRQRASRGKGVLVNGGAVPETDKG